MQQPLYESKTLLVTIEDGNIFVAYAGIYFAFYQSGDIEIWDSTK